MRGLPRSRRRNLRLQVLPEDTYAWTEEQSRKNFEAVSKFVVPGTPARAACFGIRSRATPAATRSTAAASTGQIAGRSRVADDCRVGAADTPRKRPTQDGRAHHPDQLGRRRHRCHRSGDQQGRRRDHTTSTIAHGVTGAPDGSHLFITNEYASARSTSSTRSRCGSISRIKLSGRPNNITMTPDGKRSTPASRSSPGRST